jgi:hypothetical protein
VRWYWFGCALKIITQAVFYWRSRLLVACVAPTHGFFWPAFRPLLFLVRTHARSAEPDTLCVEAQVGRRRNPANPPCWDYSDMVDPRKTTCRLEDGTAIPYCVEISFATNAFVFECRGEYSNDLTCGTYVELHKPGAAPTAARVVPAVAGAT